MVHLLANKTNFATKGFALDLALKRAKDNPENVLLCRLWRISNCYDIISILSSVVLMCFEDNDCVSMFVMMKSHISNQHANYQNVRVFWFGSGLLSITRCTKIKSRDNLQLSMHVSHVFSQA